MKTSLMKLRGGFAALKHDRKDKKRHHHAMLQLDELCQAQQDMQDIRDCYDKLLSAAAATANSTYEFSVSLGDIGDCLLEKTAVSDFDDEESGKVLLMLGKVQFELQRLVDIYRSHVTQTITIPSESLLNELHVVEEMKKRCDVKRQAYEDMLEKQRQKGKLKGANHHLQIARDECDEEANALIFRMRSLKQGQCRSLLTQAARHHAAQLSFFKKAFKSLEAIEPHVKSVTEEQHIDYQFSGLEDDDSEHDDESDGSGKFDADDDSRDDSELSFEYKQDDQRQDAILKNSVRWNGEVSPGSNSFAFKEVKKTSKSAPLFADRKLDPTYRPAELRPSPSQKYTSYALPTPPEAKSPVSVISDTVPGTRRASLGTINLWHSSPLYRSKYEKLVGEEVLSGPMLLNTKSVLGESNHNTKARPLPPPLTESLIDPSAASDAKKVKRQAFSGPLTRKPLQNEPSKTATGPIGSVGYPLPSRSLLRSPLTQPLSTPKLSSRASHSFVSSPKISELHELPRPPPHLASKRPSTQIGYSGPLPTKGPELSATNKLVVSATATSLPVPPMVIQRSYSIPSSGQVEMALHALKPLEASHDLQRSEELGSPLLAPISLSNIPPISPAS